MTPKEFCEKHNACLDEAEFAMKYGTMAEAWDNCPRVDWMIWIMDRLEIKMDDKKARLFTCWCVRETPLADGRKVFDLPTDERSRKAVEVAEAYANGLATIEELAPARSAAAAYAADAAARAAAPWDAARDAAEAAQAVKFREFFANPFAK